MDASGTNINFNDFSSKFNENFDINLRDLCVTKSVMKPADFFKGLQENMRNETAVHSPNRKEIVTVSDYADLFKVLDTYPSNLQRLPKKRELQRANSVTLKATDNTQDQTAINTSSTSLTHSILRLEDQRSAAEVYNNFKKFQQKLGHLYQEINALDKAQTVCLSKIAQLQNFAQQLQKLMPSEREAPDAFTDSETDKLMAIAENMKQLNYLRANSLSQLANHSQAPSAARLEVLVDVLTYTLMEISCYNTL